MYKLRYTKKYGRGMYATENIRKGRIIMVNDMIIGSYGGELTDKYAYDAGRGKAGIALGDISLVNHSSEPNCESSTYGGRPKRPVIVLQAIKSIKKGEQLFVNYGYDPVEQDRRRDEKRKRSFRFKRNGKEISKGILEKAHNEEMGQSIHQINKSPSEHPDGKPLLGHGLLTRESGSNSNFAIQNDNVAANADREAKSISISKLRSDGSQQAERTAHRDSSIRGEK